MPTAQNILFQIVQVIDPATKDDQIFQDDASAVAIASSTNATPIVVTTDAAHGLRTGYRAHIKNHLVNTAANNTQANPSWRVTVLTATTLSLDGSVGNGVGVNTGTLVGALVGSVDGDKYTRFRHLHVYNIARITLASAISQTYNPIQRSYAITGQIVTMSDLEFNGGVATIPAGYIDPIHLSRGNGDKISILPLSLLEVTSPRESAVNPLVYEEASVFRSPHGNAYISDGADYILRYYGLEDFTLSGIVAGVVLENFNKEWTPHIVEMAQMVLRETGSIELNGIARAIVEGKRREIQ